MSNIREGMPILLRHEGVWDGTYTYFNDKDEMIDRHKSRLLCRLPDDGPYAYHQTNFYTWDDGRTDVRDFPAEYRDGRIWWDNDLIVGWCGELNYDALNRTSVLYWQRKGDPALYLYEMIQISDDSQNRCRTWHWIRNGKLEMRTAIQEQLVSRDWRGIEAEMKAKAA